MNAPIPELTDRMRQIFGLVVEAYLERGAPVGSKLLAGSVSLSPASIRGVMQELEERGLLTHPHTSAGRMPTETGLRLFVDGIMQASLPGPARARGDRGADRRDRPVEEALEAATATLSGLSACAGVIMAPKQELRLRAAELRALVAGPRAGGAGRHRRVGREPRRRACRRAPARWRSPRSAITSPPASAGLTLGRGRGAAARRDRRAREAIDAAAAELVASGLAAWSEDAAQRPVLIVRGQANLLDDAAAADLERVRRLLDELEDRQEIARLLEGARDGEGCRIFIGSENRMFALSGSRVIAAPYRGSEGQVVGVVGVIGPTRLNYARVVPMVDFTAQALTRWMA